MPFLAAGRELGDDAVVGQFVLAEEVWPVSDGEGDRLHVRIEGRGLRLRQVEGTPTVIIGAATMKMMSASTTSMKGVMLISLMAPLRRSAPAPPLRPALSSPCRHGHRSVSSGGQRQAFVDLPGQDRERNSSREAFQARLRLGDFGLELVVGEHRRDGGEQADGGGEQRLRDCPAPRRRGRCSSRPRSR